MNNICDSRNHAEFDVKGKKYLFHEYANEGF